MIDTQSLTATWAPRVLAALRVMAGLLFLQHGLAKLINFPPGVFPEMPPLASMMGIAALLETAGPPFLILGLFTRPVAFILAGEMAVAYFGFHAANSFFPLVNHGEGAILFCFIFLYLFAAGPGAWSLDGKLARRPPAA
jgi:putative oxidoreductase